MKIFTRYVLKEISSHSLLGLLIFTFVIYFPHLNRLLELVVRRSMPASAALLLFLLPLPEVLTLTIPIAILLGTLIGLSRMAADGEVIAARAAGLGIDRFARPVLLYALAGWMAASAMSLVFSPAAAWKLQRMETSLRATQLSYEIKPRVFIEQFHGLLIYLKDVTSSGARWKGVFIADESHPNTPRITLAESGYLVSGPGGLTLHLEHGATHQLDPRDPLLYSVTSFTNTDIHIPMDESHPATPRLRPAPDMTLPQLVRYIRDPRYRRDGLVELNYRLALPLASLALAWVALPLGLISRKGGKAVGVMLAVLLVFIYYVIMTFGLELAKEGRLNPITGLWAANVLFALGGLIAARRLRAVHSRAERLYAAWERWTDRAHGRRNASSSPRVLRDAAWRPKVLRGRVLQLVDLYIVRDWIFYFVLTQVALSGLYLIFDFLQLLSSIAAHHVPAALVASYYAYLLPQVTYLMLPVSVLVATLVDLSLLTKTSQITALKAAGISLYRVAVPVLALGALASAGMFLMGSEYLPAANQRQDALRNEIQGRPAQTSFQPGWQWIFGRGNRIYHYRFFDSAHNVFADLSVLDFNSSFQITRRLYAKRAFWEPHVRQWILEDGWRRQIEGDRVTHYEPFSVAAFPSLTEDPSYFSRTVRPSEQMNVAELGRYIQSLRQSGFDVVRLSVEFYRKFSYPLVALVVALIGIPFSFTVGRKGALTGIALSLVIAIGFWSISSLFQAMGNLGQLPPVVAAWSPDVLFALGGAYLLARVRT